MQNLHIAYISNIYRCNMAKNIDIPNGWEKTEFSNIVILRNKKYTPKDSENLKCIELECIEKENGNLLYYLNSNTQKSTKTYFYKNDILYGKLRPYLKKFIYAKDDGVCSSEIWVFSATKKINNYFLFLIVQTNKFNYITNISTGTRMPRADWDIVSNYPILLPPLAEQEKIAEILSLWDKAIEQTKELIAYKEKQKKGLMQNLLTGKKRLHGFTDEWKTTTLGEVAEITTGNKNNEDKIDNGQYPFFVRSKNIERINTYSFDGEAILVPGDGNIGDIYHYINGKFDFHQRVYKISNFREINAKFLYYNMQLLFKKRAISQTSKATVNSLRMDTFTKYDICMPFNLDEQKAIADILCKANEEIELLNKQLDLYTEQKKGLMQNLLTGKVRVTV